MSRRHFTVVILACFLASQAPAYSGEPVPSRVAGNIVQKRESFWEQIQSDPIEETYTSRELFRYALALCEADRHLDRLDRIFSLAAEMQQRDPEQSSYGNFHWYSDRPEVKDRNAVEFCMEAATIIWLRHRKKIPEAAHKRLKTTLEYAVDGCLNHRVGPEYTNIALINAGNLIRLGEGLNRKKVAEEGYSRLLRFTAYTWQFGIHEYASPTYYAVDLTALQLLERFSERASGRRSARALLKLFWTDIAASWFEPSNRLAGATSRTYDYLYNRGGVRRLLRLRGLKSDRSVNNHHLLAAYGRWSPPREIHQLNEVYPRSVRASWGNEPRESRALFVHKNVALGVSSTQYFAMDVPMAFDLADRKGSSLTRGYFLPDGRNDPYGQNPYDIGSGHKKARHLRTFWTAAQRENDAVGVCVYKLKGNERKQLDTLKSHFVLPRNVDEIWINDRKLDLKKNHVRRARRYSIPPGGAVVVRHGDAAAGLRLLFARKEDGSRAPATLIDGSTAVQAEQGMVSGDVRIRTDERASGGKYVFMGEHGKLRVPLTIDEAGNYSIWGRITAPDGKSDSFFVRLTSDDRQFISKAPWHTGRSSTWRWRRMEPEGHESDGKFRLPEGDVTLELHAREKGTRIDKLAVSGDSVHEAMRLTVNHAAERRTEPGASGFWVRVADHLPSDSAFHNWRKRFVTSDYQADVSDQRVALSVPANKEQVRVHIEEYGGSSPGVQLKPPPSDRVLEIQGRDRGREILSSIPPFNGIEQRQPVRVDQEQPVYIEVESGLVVPPFRIADDSNASNNQYVKAGDRNERALRGAGKLSIPIHVQQSGEYYLWGRVIAPNPKSDSFFIKLKQDGTPLFPEFAWHTGQSKQWQWRRIKPRDRNASQGFQFPNGKITLNLFGREAGTNLDVLFISSSPDDAPE